MLLVHNDETEAGEGSEGGRPRSHHDVGLPALDAAPLIQPFARRETAVQQRDPVCKAGAESLSRQGCQGDLRNQHERLPALPDNLLDDLKIDLGLPAPGRAEQKRREESS